MLSILVADSDEARARELCRLLEFLSYAPCLLAPGLGTGDLLARLSSMPATDGVVLGGSRVGALRDLRARHPELPVLALVERAARLDAAAAGALAGAITVALPLRYPALDEALRRAGLRTAELVPGRQRPPELFRSLVGSSAAIRRVHELVEHVARSDATVLLLGESGTGKEVVARNIHYLSARRYRPFVPVNCGAIPADLLESELFGHERGAFTGATGMRIGRFEVAEGGTLFLDEIGDMPGPMQVKLLRVIQDRTFERVGSNHSRLADIRIIAATHVNLIEAVRAGRFRQDLYYRLNVFPVEVPPLRERREDLPMLVGDLLRRFEHEGRGSLRLAPGVIDELSRCAWPGNVRELANLIERLAIMHPDGVAGVDDLPPPYRRPDAGASPEGPAAAPGTGVVPDLGGDGLDLAHHLRIVEETLIRQALARTHGVIAEAARLLRLRRTTLVEKMRRLGIERETPAA